jgi:peptide/nickel transport system permease protein
MGFLKRFARNRGAVIGLALLLILILFALIAPYLYPQSPWRVVGRPFVPPFTLERLPLGTDTLGRDIAAGLVHGARVSLMIGVVSTLVALLIGVPLGAVAGYAGGLVDDLLMRFTEFSRPSRASRSPSCWSLSCNLRSARSCWRSGSCRGRPWRASSAAKCCH